jgi:peptidoglycan/xylan/chitin deacetylase (PgdA/CDA1 family)
VNPTARRRLVALVSLAACGLAVAVVLVTGSGSTAPSTETAGKDSSERSGGGSGGESHRGWVAYRGPVPILEYHAIQPPVASSSYPELFVPEADFEAQMSWLDKHGYQAVTLSEVQGAWAGAGKLPPKPVVVTFDDGYLSQFVGAFPIMQQLHWPGVLDLKAAGSDLPDADVRKMIDSGWELASHTINHLDVTTLDSATLHHELADSKRILESRFGVKIHNFCYPAGHYDQAAVDELRRDGYRGATTELPGLAERTDPYALARLEIELSDRLPGFVAKLRSAAPQGAAPPSA